MKKSFTLYSFLFLFILNPYKFCSSQTFGSGQLGIKIPNDATSLYLPITVSGLSPKIDSTFGLESVYFDLSHTACWDIRAQLIAPDGTRISIVTDNGDTLNNFKETCFKMSAVTSVFDGTAPFTGNYRPIGDLGAVNNGQNPNGEWAIIVTDDTKLIDTGTFNNWSLTFSNVPAQPLNFSSNLPIITINTNGQYIVDEPKKMIDIGIIYNGINKRNYLRDTIINRGKAGIEFRGSSSQQFSKKSYGLETIDNLGRELDTSLLGMPPEHDWVLYSPYLDKSLMRNFLTYKLFGDMGNYSVKTKFIELVINNQYQGVYVLTEKIKRDKGRVNISKLTTADTLGDNLTGGYIIKIDKVNGNAGGGWYSKYASNITNDSSVYFQYEYPKPDTIQQAQKDYIKDYIDSFENVLKSQNFADPINGYRKYIDISSFIDYFIINEISKNVDAYRVSEFLYKDKNSKGGKLKNGPVWDFDIAWGNANFNNAGNSSGWEWKWAALEYFTPFWWSRFMEDTTFVNELYCRYWFLRGNVLDTATINHYIDSVASDLNEAQKRNFYQWPVIGKNIWTNPTPIPTSYQEEISSLKNWVNSRISWIDANLPGRCTPLGSPSFEITDHVVRVFPNPFSTFLKVNYEIPETSKVRLELFNSMGIMALEIFESSQSKGIYQQEIITSELPSGIYILKLTIGEQVFHQKIIKIE